MPGDPKPGMRYRQEYYRGEAEDNGEVLSTREMAETPFGQFDRALLTKDTIAIEPKVLEYKLYAPGVGPVLVLGVSGGGGREELVKRDNAPTNWTKKPAPHLWGRGRPRGSREARGHSTGKGDKTGSRSSPTSRDSLPAKGVGGRLAMGE